MANKMKSLALITFFTLIVPNCDSIQQPVQPKPVEEVRDSAYCDLAETHLKQLKCIPDGAFTKKGKSFSDFCQETQINGVFVNPKCLSEIVSCDQMDVCTNSK